MNRSARFQKVVVHRLDRPSRSPRRPSRRLAGFCLSLAVVGCLLAVGTGSRPAAKTGAAFRTPTVALAR